MEAWAFGSCSLSYFGTALIGWHCSSRSFGTSFASTGIAETVGTIETGGTADTIRVARRDSVGAGSAEGSSAGEDCSSSEASAAGLVAPPSSFSGTCGLLKRPELGTFGAGLSSCGAAFSGVPDLCI